MNPASMTAGTVIRVLLALNFIFKFENRKEMSDWFTFHADREAKVITIEVDAKTLLENQPKTYEEADEVCMKDIIPIVDTLRDACVVNGYGQKCMVDLNGVDVTLMSPSILTRIIWNIYEHNKDKPENLVSEFRIANANTIFKGIYTVARNLLPKYMKDLITFS